ncbi:MAG TPA: hypothetical protein VFS39_14900 [Nitrospira sp.]|nr:hypothetical protein [Nitrospira sp.]
MLCQKCNGLMIEESRPEFSSKSSVQRCINCGLLLDPLIAQNRLLKGRGKQPALDAA